MKAEQIKPQLALEILLEALNNILPQILLYLLF